MSVQSDIPGAVVGRYCSNNNLQEWRALRAARLLQQLVRSRRFHLDEFLDGDGPYWISIGLYINDCQSIETTYEQVIEFADESIETSAYLLRQMIERDVVRKYISRSGIPIFRLTPAYTARLEKFLQQQFSHMSSMCQEGR